jgi:TonB family protein
MSTSILNSKRLLTALIVCGTFPALASDVKVIANPSIRADSITASEIKSVFLQEKRSLSEGSHVEPVFARSGSAHQAFLKRYLGKSEDALQDYFRTMAFTGTGSMPKFLGSDLEIVAYVAKTKGAIGYVDSDVSVEGVKVLLVSNGANRERTLITRVEPEFPETLRRLQISGVVRLKVTIAPKGNVVDVKVLGGNPILAENAIKAVKQWTYTPGPSQTDVEVSIPFDASR